MRYLILAGALALAGTATLPAYAATTHIPQAAVKTAIQLRKQARHDDTAYQLVRDLTTQVGPRLAGGANDAKARAWLMARLKKMGFDRVYTEPVSYPKWVRRSESGAIVSPYRQHLVLSALGYSAGTPKGGLTAEVVAFKNLAALKAAPAAKVRGKIVYLGQRMHRFRDGRDYGRIGSPQRVAGPPIAAAKGAVAYILRSAGTDMHERIAHTGVTGFTDPAKAIPAAALSNPDADQLERELASGQPVRVHLELDVGFDGRYTGANVVAELDGSRYPHQFIDMGGHLDFWDPGTGAIDDGAGIAIAVGAAHLIAQLPQRPARGIRVIAFANEEFGLWGGKAYARAHAKDVTDHVLGSESDLGADRIYRMSASVKPEARPAVAQIATVLKPLGVAYDPKRPGGGGSDLSQMHGVGMAALSLSQDATRYFDWHHTSNDTLDKIDRDALAQNVAVYAVWSYMAAQAQGDFGSGRGAFAGDGAGE